MTNTDGDLSPMLSQPPDENAPMISGRGTKVIADARGAYLAGNLAALLEHMDEAQQRRLRVAGTRQALLFVRNSLEDGHPDDLHALDLLEAWVRDPASDPNSAINHLMAAERVIEVEEYDGTTEDGEEGGMIYDVADADSAYVYYAALVPVMTHLADALDLPIDIMLSEESRKAARQWQVEAAWATLQGKDLPDLEVL